MSGPVQSFEEEPEEAVPVKHIAKELFPDGDHLSRSGNRTWSIAVSEGCSEEHIARKTQTPSFDMMLYSGLHRPPQHSAHSVEAFLAQTPGWVLQGLTGYWPIISGTS